MATLYLMRHGHADSSRPDDRRALTADGARLISEASIGMRSMGVQLDTVLHSPLVRTSQTAATLVEAMGLGIAPGGVDALRPGAQPGEVFEALRHELGANSMLVGHMPDISFIAAYFATGHVSSVVSFSPGTVACIEFVTSVRPGAGTIRWVMSSQQLIQQGSGA